VAVGVVDRLEPVQIDVENGDLPRTDRRCLIAMPMRSFSRFRLGSR
jgi:hypothetical protein